MCVLAGSLHPQVSAAVCVPQAQEWHPVVHKKTLNASHAKRKREEHRVTYKSGGRSSQVDYILCRRGNLKEISDCKVVVGESVARQHRMVVCRMTLMVCKTKRSKIEIEKKTKWWKLKKEECCEEFRQKLRQALGGQVVLPDDWETTAEVIRETGRKVLGVSSGRRKEDKETWWWNEEVQDSVQRKRLAKKKWDMDRTEENRQEYKELQRRVKREVSKAKQKAYDELYTRLDTREGQKDLYRLARQRDRDGKDVQQVRVIKDRDGRVLTSEESVQRRWKEYFEELMNEENEREKRVEGVNSVEQKVDKIRKDEVRKALKRMKSGKAVGPDDIQVEVWKCLGEAAVELTSLFNRVLENLEKAYDRVPREELWYCMRKSGVAAKYVRVVQDMYERSRTVVRCAVGQTEEFNVEVGLHQGSALSPFLFAIVMDQLSDEVRQESPWTMMFADDIVICSESREQVEENLERWRFALERRGMKVSRSKTEYMCVNEREGSGTVRLQGEEVKKVQEFKYLGSTVQSNGECGKEVKKRVQAGVTFSDSEGLSRCLLCSQCPLSIPQLARCTVTQDTHCDCGPGFFLWKVRNDTKAICAPCAVCGQGEGVVRACSPAGNTVCQPCGPGTFSEDRSSSQACMPCSLCNEDTVEIRPCQAKSDTLCMGRELDIFSTNGSEGPWEYPRRPVLPDEEKKNRMVTVSEAPDLSSEHHKGGNNILIYVSVLAAVVLGLLIYVAYKCWKSFQQKAALGKARAAELNNVVEGEKLHSDSGVFLDSHSLQESQPSKGIKQDSKQDSRYINLPPHRQEEVEKLLAEGGSQNWRQLATMLGYEQERVDMFGRGEDPIHTLLTDWAQQDSASLEQLSTALSNIERHDVAKALSSPDQGITMV
ncbi:hypothetical protein QTP86_020466 [Hemibagrus guttatus]|nr:hypothetical protein QTP86_020466 [Hemibagrus guttatus]